MIQEGKLLLKGVPIGPALLPGLDPIVAGIGQLIESARARPPSQPAAKSPIDQQQALTVRCRYQGKGPKVAEGTGFHHNLAGPLELKGPTVRFDLIAEDLLQSPVGDKQVADIARGETVFLIADALGPRAANLAGKEGQALARLVQELVRIAE